VTTKPTGPGILPALDKLAVPIDSIGPWPGNPRKGDLRAIRESLARTGQYRPLIVQAGTNYIMAGNQTWHAARELGWRKIAVLTHEVDDETGRRIVAVDNRSSDLAGYDDALLADLLSGLDDLIGSGYSPDDLDDLLAKVSAEGAAVVLDESPTEAKYSESPEHEAQRAARIAEWEPHYSTGLTEVILVYPEATRTTVLYNIDEIRQKLGKDATASDSVDVALQIALLVAAGECEKAQKALAPP